MRSDRVTAAPPIVESTVGGIRARVRAARDRGDTVAFVPTMGALHEGHLSLVERARRAAATVVVSIFVNPLQFGADEDFDRYPRTLGADVALLERTGASALVFAPSAAEMYGEGRGTTVVPRAFADTFEGAVRPGHFTGVLTVVAKLFNIVQPDVAIFGRKDLQQLALVRAMVDDLNFPVRIEGGETIREHDALARSSRNRYLSPEERAAAPALYRALELVRDRFRAGESEHGALLHAGRSALERRGIAVDYLDVVDAATFEPQACARGGDAVIVAARIGSTRLIDNLEL